MLLTNSTIQKHNLLDGKPNGNKFIHAVKNNFVTTDNMPIAQPERKLHRDWIRPHKAGCSVSCR